MVLFKLQERTYYIGNAGSSNANSGILTDEQIKKNQESQSDPDDESREEGSADDDDLQDDDTTGRGVYEDVSAAAPAADSEQILTGDEVEDEAREEGAADDEDLQDDDTETVEIYDDVSAAAAAADEGADVDTAASEYVSNRKVVKKGATYPSADIINKAFEMNAGDTAIIESEDGEHIYIIAKLDLNEDESYFETAKQSLLFEMKEDDYDALIDTWINSQLVIPTEEARKRYDPTKIFKEEKN